MIEKYGSLWPDGTEPIIIERSCIRKGGSWKDSKGRECGNGLFYHYKEFQSLLWPWKDWHKWNVLLLKQFCENNLIGILGPASSGKTHEVAAFILSDYFCFPNNTTALVCSTTLPMLELRIWGELKKLFFDAQKRHVGSDGNTWLPGHIMDSKHRITTDSKNLKVRDFRNGIQGIACLKTGSSSASMSGLASFAGVKNERVRLAGDELQFLPQSFIDSFSNLSKTPKDFKGFGMGNPQSTTDALAKICEPEGGWGTEDRSEITKTWRGKLSDCTVIQLVGPDGPNKEYPDGKERYPYLIKNRDIAKDLRDYGRDSLQFAMMDLGMMPMAGTSNRVITEAMCRDNGAYEDAIFAGDVRKIFALDAAYGSIGGDRCVGGEFWIGKDVSGKWIFSLRGNPIIIPVSYKKKDTSENQIVDYVKAECVGRGIVPAHLFYDASGRGSLGIAFGRRWSTEVNPIEFSGKPSDMPVSDVDRRPCHQAYGKKVTELWYQVALAIQSGQVRGLTSEVVEEGCGREYKMIDGRKVDVEAKAEMKLRMKRSPDLFDMVVSGFFGARLMGFSVAKSEVSVKAGPSFWERERKRIQSFRPLHTLTYA